MRNKNAKVSDPNDFITSSGDKFHILYESKVMPDGTIKLIECGKEDINEYINSQRDCTDMSYILKKLSMGDTSVLNQNNAMFGDFTSMPKSYAESLQLVIDSKKKFYDLPVETRQKFSNSFEKWFATAGQPEWIKNMGFEKKNTEGKETACQNEGNEDD